MALQDIRGGLYVPVYPPLVSGDPDLRSTLYIMDAADEQVGPIFRVPKAGQIAKVGFRVQAVTSAPSDNHEVRIEGVSATTGLADGTLIAANANATVLLNSTGWKLVTLTSAPTVTKGQLIAVRVKAPAANFGNIALATFADAANTGFPYSDVLGSKSVSQGAVLTLEYSDGSYDVVEGIYPYSVINTRTFNSSTNPNHRAMRFRVQFKARLTGMWLWAAIANDIDLVFFDSDGVTSTVLLSVDDDQLGSGSAVIHKFSFATAKTIEPNTWYRLAIVPTTTSNMSIFDADVNAAADLDALAGGQDFHLSTANGAPSAEGDWTQTLSNRPFMGLLFDQLSDDVGSGGGGSRGFGMTGGMA